ncbi:MAG: hypothetical protein AAF492_32735, partial [Verrucomicrobiota bacterium]
MIVPIDRKAFLEAPLEPDPVIEFYKKDVDRTLLRENLKLTDEERCQKFLSFMRFIRGVRNSRT